MGCVNSVKNVLNNQSGVTAVAASLEPAQAIVQYDPDATNPGQLKAAIIDAGFDVVD